MKKEVENLNIFMTAMVVKYMGAIALINKLE